MRTNWSVVMPNQTKFIVKPHLSSGFTLIEIMIAMVIVSVGVVSVMTATAKNIEISSELEQRIVASWVVSNRLAEIRHQSKLENIAVGNNNTSVEMGGYDWRVRTTIEQSNLNRVFLVTVEARDKNQTDDVPKASLSSSLSDKL